MDCRRRGLLHFSGARPQLRITGELLKFWPMEYRQLVKPLQITKTFTRLFVPARSNLFRRLVRHLFEAYRPGILFIADRLNDRAVKFRAPSLEPPAAR